MLGRVSRLVAIAATLVAAWPGPGGAATLTVTECADGIASGTLRSLVIAANPGDTVALPACAIALTAVIPITKDLTIAGAGADRSFLDGGLRARIFDVAGGVTATISDLTIQNGGVSPIGNGGGIVNAGTLTVRRAVIRQGVALRGAAIDSGPGSRLTVLDSTITGNIVLLGGFGGAILSNSALSFTMVNTTVSGNIANEANTASVIGIGGNATITNSTIADNVGTTGALGGLIWNLGPVTLKNTILVNNTSGGTLLNCQGAIASAGHNVDSGASCPATGPGDRQNTNPLLGPLRDNGGPTPTHLPLAGSPVVDTGDNAGCPTTDQRGIPRPLDGTGGPVTCDIGAVEVLPRLIATGVGPGGGPHVRLWNPVTGALVFEFFPYDLAARGGVRVALGDVNGDGVPDLVTAPGAGGGPHVRVFDGAALLRHQQTEIVGLFAYDPGFTGGVFVAAGDVDGDGRADVITGTGTGGAAHVRVFSGTTGAQLGLPGASFFAYDPGFTGGVFVGGAQ
jgi:hypothetical protein